MKLDIGPFKKIANGKKLIESRLYDEKRKQINIGDQIEFACKDKLSDNILTKVQELYQYKSFEELFSSFPSEYFGGGSKDQLIKNIEKFYSKEKQDKYGVLGIKIELI